MTSPVGSSVPGNTPELAHEHRWMATFDEGWVCSVCRERPAPTAQEQYAATTRKPISELVRELIDAVGTTLVAYMADVKSRQLPARWADAKVAPRRDAQMRLLLAHQVFMTVAGHESADTARAWLIGSNPRLGGFPPADLIREFAAASVYGAMQAFIEDTGGA